MADTLSKRPITTLCSISKIIVDAKFVLLVEHSKNIFVVELMDG